VCCATNFTRWPTFTNSSTTADELNETRRTEPGGQKNRPALRKRNRAALLNAHEKSTHLK
jgi:hypothetical protein